jgi:hypothetical protein
LFCHGGLFKLINEQIKKEMNLLKHTWTCALNCLNLRANSTYLLSPESSGEGVRLLANPISGLPSLSVWTNPERVAFPRASFIHAICRFTLSNSKSFALIVLIKSAVTLPTEPFPLRDPGLGNPLNEGEMLGPFGIYVSLPWPALLPATARERSTTGDERPVRGEARPVTAGDERPFEGPFNPIEIAAILGG